MQQTTIRREPLDRDLSICDAMNEAIWEAKRHGMNPTRIFLGMWKWYQFRDAISSVLVFDSSLACCETRYYGLLVERVETPGIVVE